MGPDAVHERKVPLSEFQRLRGEAISWMVARGARGASVTLDSKNWAVVRDRSSGFKAVLLDVGGVDWKRFSMKRKQSQP